MAHPPPISVSRRLLLIIGDAVFSFNSDVIVSERSTITPDCVIPGIQGGEAAQATPDRFACHREGCIPAT